PLLAIRACLAHAGVELADIDEVAFGWQHSSAVRSADMRDFLTGAHPMGWWAVLRAQTVGPVRILCERWPGPLDRGSQRQISDSLCPLRMDHRNPSITPTMGFSEYNKRHCSAPRSS